MHETRGFVLQAAPWLASVAAAISCGSSTGGSTPPIPDAGFALDANGADGSAGMDGSSATEGGPAADGESGGACTMTFSGALTQTFPCTGYIESAGSIEEIVFEFDLPGFPDGAANGAQLGVSGALAPGSYTQAQFSLLSCQVEDNTYAPPVTDAGFGGFARWGCEAGGTACPSFALTLTSVDKLTPGQAIRFGSGSNTHGTFDVTLPSSGCAGCTTMPVGNLIVSATF